MVKKIGVFIMILGLFFVGIPRFNVKADSYDQGYDEGWDAGFLAGGGLDYNDGYSDGYSDAVRGGSGYNEGYSDGHSDGYNEGYGDGSNDGYWIGYDVGYDNGVDNGYILGYQAGLSETDATGFNGLLITVFGGLGALLGIEILPGIYIGAIIAVPLVFGIIFFILGKRKGD